MSLLHPPPTRRSTGGNAVNGTNFSNNSNASINSIDNQSSEDGAGDSDEGSPTALAASSQNMQYQIFRNLIVAPIFGGPLHEISSRGKVDAIGFYGTTVCFSSASTTVAMDILTGERFWALSHSDTKITAIEFKPEKILNCVVV